MLTVQQYMQAEFDYSLAEARRGFKIHAAIYTIVMTGLITLNALLWTFADGDFPWAVFPLVGWGIGLTFHYIDAYRREGRSIRDRQHEIEACAERTKELV